MASLAAICEKLPERNGVYGQLIERGAELVEGTEVQRWLPSRPRLERLVEPLNDVNARLLHLRFIEPSRVQRLSLELQRFPHRVLAIALISRCHSRAPFSSPMLQPADCIRWDLGMPISLLGACLRGRMFPLRYRAESSSPSAEAHTAKVENLVIG